MLQDIYPHKLKNQYLPGQLPSEESVILHFQDDKVLLHQTEPLRFLRKRELLAPCSCQYLFTLDEEAWFLCMEEGCPAPPDYGYKRVHALRTSKEQDARHRVFALYTAYQLANWYRDNHFCGRCGNETRPAHAERALFCPHCKRTIYPRIVPAVIVGVINGDSLLMTKYADRPISFYALIAGFTEIGETLEETVRREVLEEAGLKVKNIRYYKSQPWGIVDDILAGFYCDVDGDANIRLDKHELKEAVWMPRREITGQPNDYSLTNEMMITFREGREPAFGNEHGG